MDLRVSVAVPHASDAAVGWLPLLACLAAADALREAAGLPAEVGWPDSVLIPGAMCGGSAGSKRVGVAELSPTGSGSTLTVSLDVRGAPTDAITSVASAGGRADADAIRAALLDHLDSRVNQWRAGDPALRTDYRARCQTVGRLADDEHWVSGVAADGTLELADLTATGIGQPAP